MKLYYRIVISDERDKPWKNLPRDIGVNFRSAKRAFNIAWKYYQQQKDVVIVEQNKDGIVEIYEWTWN